MLALKQVRLDSEAEGDLQLLTAVQNEIELMRTFKVPRSALGTSVRC